MVSIEKSGPPFVKKNQARKGCQPAKEPRENGLLPAVFDVTHPTENKNQINGTFAQDLIRDIDVTTLCIVRFRTRAASQFQGLCLDRNCRRVRRVKRSGRVVAGRPHCQWSSVDPAEL